MMIDDDTCVVLEGRERYLRLIPAAITLVGLTLSLLWINGDVPLWVGIFGWSLDALDGMIARALNAETWTGAQLDRLSDVVLASLVAFVVLHEPGLVAAIIMFAAADVRIPWPGKPSGQRVCGRTIVMLIAIATSL